MCANKHSNINTCHRQQGIMERMTCIKSQIERGETEKDTAMRRKAQAPERGAQRMRAEPKGGIDVVLQFKKPISSKYWPDCCVTEQQGGPA